MAGRKREGALTKDEKRIVKALLADGWRNQDIQPVFSFGARSCLDHRETV